MQHLKIFDPGPTVLNGPSASEKAAKPHTPKAIVQLNRVEVASQELAGGVKSIECGLDPNSDTSFIISRTKGGGFDITLPRGPDSLDSSPQRIRVFREDQAELRASFTKDGELVAAYQGKEQYSNPEHILTLIDQAVSRRLEQYVNDALFQDPVPRRVLNSRS